MYLSIARRELWFHCTSPLQSQQVTQDLRYQSSIGVLPGALASSRAIAALEIQHDKMQARIVPPRNLDRQEPAVLAELKRGIECVFARCDR